MIVVATTEEQAASVREELERLGLGDIESRAPSSTRRLLSSPVLDTTTGHRAVTGLRKKGYPAVLRPDSGPQLEAWMRHTQPVTVSDRLTVAYAWSEHDRSDLPNVIEIDPAGGFGTAQHPATRLILEELVARIAGGERVLDVGCGNGILGLAALRLGAARLVAVDIDPGAVEATARNAALNGFGHLLDRQVGGVFDGILANIGRAALIELGPDLASQVAPSGWAVVSGFSPPQCQVVAAAFHPLKVMDRREEGEWASLTLGRASE